jgi:hypothetical protein
LSQKLLDYAQTYFERNQEVSNANKIYDFPGDIALKRFGTVSAQARIAPKTVK